MQLLTEALPCRNVTLTVNKKAGTKGDLIQMVCIKLENDETVTGMSVRTGSLQPICEALKRHQQECVEKMQRAGIAAAEAAPARGSADDAHALAAAALAGARPG